MMESPGLRHPRQPSVDQARRYPKSPFEEAKGTFRGQGRQGLAGPCCSTEFGYSGPLLAFAPPPLANPPGLKQWKGVIADEGREDRACPGDQQGR